MPFGVFRFLVVIILASMQIAAWWVPPHHDAEHDCCNDSSQPLDADVLTAGELECDQCPEICCNRMQNRNSFETRSVAPFQSPNSTESHLSSQYRNPFRSHSLIDDEGEPPKA